MSTEDILVLDVEYCGAWGYDSRFRSLRLELLSSLPPQTTAINGSTGRVGSFELTIYWKTQSENKQTLFSKLATNAFPDPADTLAAIQEFKKTGKILPIKAAPKSCTIQ